MGDPAENITNAISIHTLHTDGDHPVLAGDPRMGGISIHTLHTEGDAIQPVKHHQAIDFNPHPPHGG